MSRKQTPSEFLKLIIGRPVVVKLNSGVDYRGVLVCLDGYMNIALEQTEEYVNGQLKNKYGDAFIRGNNAMAGQEKSSIYQERDFFLDMSSCSLFMLAQATSLGDNVVERLVESSLKEEQMNYFGEMIDVVFSTVSNIYSSQPRTVEDSQIDQYKSLIMAVLSTLCNLLACERGRKWFRECKPRLKVVKKLVEFEKLASLGSNEEKLLKSIFNNLMGSVDCQEMN